MRTSLVRESKSRARLALRPMLSKGKIILSRWPAGPYRWLPGLYPKLRRRCNSWMHWLGRLSNKHFFSVPAWQPKTSWNVQFKLQAEHISFASPWREWGLCVGAELCCWSPISAWHIHIYFVMITGLCKHCTKHATYITRIVPAE